MPGVLEKEHSDLTVVHPSQRAQIEAYSGIYLKDADPDAIRFVVEKSKQAGNDAFKRKKYHDAIRMYSQAIAGDDKDHTLFANRSAAYLALGLYDHSLWDANKAVSLSPSWPKAYYRLGSAYAALNQWHHATISLQKGRDLDPSNKDLQQRLNDAQQRVQEELHARNAAAATERRSLILKLRNARREDQKLAMLNQFKQSMTAPDWDLEDLEWRPSWSPAMRVHPLNATSFRSNPKNRMLLSFLESLSDLAFPKLALKSLSDASRMQGFADSIAADDADLVKGKHVLCLEAGGGVLPIIAAQHGRAMDVIVVERSRMLYRMAKQVMTSNTETLKTATSINLLPKSLYAIANDNNNDGEEVPVTLASKQVEVLITDMFDHSVLGMGVLPAIDHAARTFLSPDSIIFPSTVSVYAALAQIRLDSISGFDLSPLDSYRWYPGVERIELDTTPHKMLSESFLACTLDLQARINVASSQSTAKVETLWESEHEIDVQITENGLWNAIVFWFELHMPAGSNGNKKTRLASYIFPSARLLNPVDCIYCPSWGQAVQYTDGINVTSGNSTTIKVCQDSGQFVFITDPPSHRLHHALTPRWHYDMVQDKLRNDAYEAALQRAIAKKKCGGGDDNNNADGCKHLIGLDMGAGSGLLSMMAARAGADEVYAAEVSAHMCDVAEETTIMNGFLGKVCVLDRDVRRMDVVMKPDGTAPELPRRADLAVFEVFDSGLIGEGILHILAAAKAKLLQENAVLVPSCATVYAQPIEMRVQNIVGVDISQTNRWRWRPDYEGIELAKCKTEWKPLADPLPVFSFDFYDVYSCGIPAEKQLEFTINQAGIFNGMAMWFDLHLDEETSLSTSPYAEKGPTWQQAVQWMAETKLDNGDGLVVTARHDSYSISYAIEDVYNAGVAEKSTGLPLVDPIWKAAHDSLQNINSELVKACVQNPLEYRSVAQAAIQFASRPHDLGLNAGQAAEFCMKMMG